MSNGVSLPYTKSNFAFHGLWVFFELMLKEAVSFVSHEVFESGRENSVKVVYSTSWEGLSSSKCAVEEVEGVK